MQSKRGSFCGAVFDWWACPEHIYRRKELIPFFDFTVRKPRTRTAPLMSWTALPCPLSYQIFLRVLCFPTPRQQGWFIKKKKHQLSPKQSYVSPFHTYLPVLSRLGSCPGLPLYCRSDVVTTSTLLYWKPLVTVLTESFHFFLPDEITLDTKQNAH